MILYFSGTGNSRYLSEVLNSEIKDEIISINDCLKTKKKYSFTSKKPYVIICPTYAWQIPRIVESFIKKTNFEGNKKIYFILTCGGGIGNAKRYVKRLVQKKNLEFMGIKAVIMPENFITMFKAPEPSEGKKIITRAIEPTLQLGKIIKKEMKFEKDKYHFGDIISSSLINKLFYAIFVKADGFYVNKNCTGCGNCKKICPLNNIEISEEKPKWSNHCTQCMACIGSCPMQAIEYKNKTQNKVRYYLNEHYE